MLNRIIKYFLENRLVTFLLLLLLIAWGIITAPFSWQFGSLPSDPVPVDAIPDIGENQQIVFTEWPGRSPQDIEDQISYPLTTYLLGIPGVKSVRSSSFFGFSSIYLIFSEEIDFYWSRSRILEKLNAMPPDLLPQGVQAALGPDATALGQVYWYTIEGRDSAGNPTGGWDLHEIRTVQDFYVKYGLSATEGVAEVASIGGFVKEYQIDVNPDALQAYQISLNQVVKAVQNSNRDVGAKTIEINQVEYLVRGLGYVKNLQDIESAVVRVKDNVPIRIKDVARLSFGPATRRGVLDKGGAEVVGGVVVTRYGANPLKTINNVKAKIKALASGMPKKKLKNGIESQLTIVPFYDRSELIYETLGTLEEALSLQVLIVILVIIVMVYRLRASLLISTLLPIAILMVFIAMRYLHVDANIVALSGIAIAIGTMVDLGIILSENIIKKMKEAAPKQSLLEQVYQGASEVSGAILTAVSTTIVSFIPVFSMQAAEGKLFGPLAYTKTFALIAALMVSLLILPTLAYWFFGFSIKNRWLKRSEGLLLLSVGLIAILVNFYWAGSLLMLFGAITFFKQMASLSINRAPVFWQKVYKNADLIVVLVGVMGLLAKYWMPLGPLKSLAVNFIFVLLLVGLILGFFLLLEQYYRKILAWCLNHKIQFLILPFLLIVLGGLAWLGFPKFGNLLTKGTDLVGWNIRNTTVWNKLTHTFPGMGKEFMPALNEGSFLLMPSSMPHSGISYNRDILAKLDMRLKAIPEVESAVGKIGRVESALDPAPISMFEHIINYKPEYLLNEEGQRQRFKVDSEGRFILRTGDSLHWEQAVSNDLGEDELIPDPNGHFYRNWREHIHSETDIWEEIQEVTNIPGITSAPKLQPIETRIIMLQTGMRAPMGIKVYGPDLTTIENFGKRLEEILKTVPSIYAPAVYADRVVGKPYLHLNLQREKIARYGLSVEDVQQTIEVAIGGMTLGSSVEGRERFPIRVRYPRELRDHPKSIEKILITASEGEQIPLKELLEIEYVRGPQVIKSEETFLVSYVLFDKKEGFSEVEAVNAAQSAIQNKIDSGELLMPAGLSYKFSGSYENQVRAEKRLALIVPLVLLIVFLILYFQFRSVSTSLMVFSGIAMAFSGGFIMLWLFGQSWFVDIAFFDTNMRELFQMKTIHLSVAVWVGFIALFGLATDDGVLMATYLDQSFDRNKTKSRETIRKAIIEGGERRIKPAIMTSATTLIALLPILTSSGRGSDIMIPMAIPAFGGMIFAAITYFIVPVLYCWREERRLEVRR